SKNCVCNQSNLSAKAWQDLAPNFCTISLRACGRPSGLMQFPFQLSTNRDFDCIGFGTNAVDYLIEVPEYPAFNSKVELNRYIQAAGGEVASTMVGLRRLGLNTAYIGRFGTDPAGDF